ncbi:ABC transporter ATP-binding protein [Pallidibacillus pasinlerensis]|uniref:ABC transporter ATP-binding protein n=1 Tax=Pallidibacillus pasinlerensis TaxID=2703818 RepID=A0ABX0A7M2_9BACI|nr:ABC transporter ATP-binding protein [Pallidibacillus pasinlerensis]NCU18044.1 ABC transporter ATP-binding protein [Pallidibacillus pasinlerensis]
MSKLEINHLSISFGSQKILDDITFTAEEGEFISILGPSGSGKSTLFNLIGGILIPDEGSILLDGKEITGKRGSISYMPQSHALMPWRTILDNVLLGQEIAGKRDEKKALEMLGKAGLKGYEKHYPHELSGGMKQRVSFIRSLLSPQSLICLDEPFSALDEFTRFEMQNWLLSVWQQYKRTILFITHNIDEALYLSDRILVLSNKPASVQKEFIVPFKRPRTEEMLYSAEFLKWKQDIYREIKQYSL